MFTVKTEDIYLSAGMDAVVLLKTMEFGICCFGPMAAVCMLVCVLPTAFASYVTVLTFGITGCSLISSNLDDLNLAVMNQDSSESGRFPYESS